MNNVLKNKKISSLLKSVLYNFLLVINLIFIANSNSLGQTGTVSSPFTSLGMAQSITTEGVYYFNLTGTTFSTYVKSGGWVQVAIDFSYSTGGSLPQQTALNNTTRGILNPATLLKLTAANIARIYVSTGGLDVQNTNLTILSRIVNNQCLLKGVTDNTINTWTGINPFNTNFNGTCDASANFALNERIMHAACNTSGIHWIPISNVRRIKNSLGEIPLNNYFQLLVRGPRVINSQPSINNQIYCLNSTSTPLNVLASGSSISYQWYSNTIASTSGGTLISGATSSSYSPPTNSAGTKYYYAIVNSSLGTEISNLSGGIEISPLSTGGTTTADQTICPGDLSNNIYLILHTGAIQWQVSTDNSSFIDIAGATSAPLTSTLIGNLSDTTYFRAVLTSGACSSAYSNVITVSVPTPTTSSAPVSSDIVWNGKVSIDWEDVNNWLSYNGTNFAVATAIPTDLTNVFIQKGSSCVLNQPTISLPAFSKKITIETGAVLTMNSGSLSVKGDWMKNGSFAAVSGDVMFNGNVVQTISGNGTSTFTNLIVNNSSTGLIINSPVEITNTLEMTAGNIVTSAANVLTLGVGSVGILNWTSGTIVGPFSRWYDATTNSGNQTGLFPIGTSTFNRWALLEFTNAPTGSGYLTAEFKEIDPSSIPGLMTNGFPFPESGVSIDDIINEGYWEIIPSPSLIGGIYSLTTRANNFLSLINFTNCRIIKSPNNHTVWTLDGIQGAVVGTSSDFIIMRSGMSGFSYFTIAFPVSALPIELISFQANCAEENMVNISWTTASEHNNDYFLIEGSRDGSNWMSFDVVDAAQNSNSIVEYFIQVNQKLTGLFYFRLSQFDLDGVSEAFNIVTTNCTNNDFNTLKVYPNPSESIFYVDYYLDENEDSGQIKILDFKGALIYSKIVPIEKGNNVFHIETLDAAPGIYFVEIFAGSNFDRVKHFIR